MLCFYEKFRIKIQFNFMSLCLIGSRKKRRKVVTFSKPFFATDTRSIFFYAKAIIISIYLLLYSINWLRWNNIEFYFSTSYVFINIIDIRRLWLVDNDYCSNRRQIDIKLFSLSMDNCWQNGEKIRVAQIDGA